MMDSIVRISAFILPVIAFSSVVLILFLNLYLKLRRQFLVSVNCWFCNGWTKVHYDEKNSFECPTCLQYNGFNSNGSYNKAIPAQHDELLNQQVLTSPKANNYLLTNTNGLCHFCNNNQQLKIYQLANFIPLNEANFDVEIEHFRKQLEKAYKLCSPCEKVVKITIHKQNCVFGLKFSQLRKKGLLLLNLNGSRNGISNKDKCLFLKSLIYFTLYGFVFLNLIFVLTEFNFSDRNLRKFIPEWALGFVLMGKNICLVSQNVSEHVLLRICQNICAVAEWFVRLSSKFPVITKLVTCYDTTSNDFVKIVGPYFNLPMLPRIPFGNAVWVCSVGSLLQFILVFWNDEDNFKRKLFRLALWSFLTFVHSMQLLNEHLKFYVDIVQVTACITIASSMYFVQNPKHFEIRKPCSQVTQKLNSSLEDMSDEEDFASSFMSQKSRVGHKTNTASFTSTRILAQPNDHESTFGQVLKKPKQYCDTNSITTIKDSVNDSFISAKSYFNDQTSVGDTANLFNNSFIKYISSRSTNLENNLDISLNKLHLGTSNVRKSLVANTLPVNSGLSRPRPVVSPAKLKNITQNSWVAGGFWRDSNGILMPVNNFSNLSRSSSQTSGFVSHAGLDPNFTSLPSSMNNSFCGDFECNSVFSEPTYYLNRPNIIGGRSLNHQFKTLPYHARTFYPIMNNEELVYIARPCLQRYDEFSDIFVGNTIGSRVSKMHSDISNPDSKLNSMNLEPGTTYKSDCFLKNWIDKMDY